MSRRDLDWIAGRKLDLGCGPYKRDADYVGIDVLDYPGVDIVGDAYEVLKSVPNDAVTEVYTSHFLEHVDNLQGLLAEIVRVLRPDGRLHVVVPHFSNAYYYSDPTHRRPFGLYTFAYFTSAVPFKRKVPIYGESLSLRLESVRLCFKSPPPFYVRYAIKRLVEVLVNLTRGTQEFYEENLAQLIPCYELRFILVRV